MTKIRFVTAGESHGQALVVILDGLPAGLALDSADINRDLARRQTGFGRGGRMAIEKDQAEILSGVRKGLTLGSPIALLIRNRDWPNWQAAMAVERGSRPEPVTLPRPGHADLAGCIKYGFTDIRNVLERASARETAARSAAGAVTRKFLGEFGLAVYSRVIRIGSVADSAKFQPARNYRAVEQSPLRCCSAAAEQKMIALIKKAQAGGDTLGGIFEVTVTGLPVGLGTYTQWDRRLDGQLAQAVMSIPGVKGVEIGPGFENAGLPGSRVQDEIFYAETQGFFRKTNRSGGLEGGMTSGQDLILRAAMKPISTLARPLATVDLASRKPATAHWERSDVCAVPAAGIVAEAMTSLVLADAFLDKFGGDSIVEIKKRVMQGAK